MGQLLNKDKNIDLYIETYKAFYFAGEFLQGDLHINCHAHSEYGQVALKLHCQEKVRWVQGGGQNTRVYMNSADTYDQSIVVYEFPQRRIQPGQYTFPFKILLPTGLPGSFQQPLGNGIRYRLTGQLHPSSAQSKLQMHEIPVNIQQPSRIPFGPASSHTENNPKCCGCCCSYGIVKVDIQCDKNQIKDGDEIKINAIIDNGFGKKDITNVQISLMQKFVQVSSWGNHRMVEQKVQYLHKLNKTVLQGTKQSMNILSQVPFNFCQHSTSIGKIIGKYFTISVRSDMGCCSEAADSELHLIYHSSNPRLEEKKLIPAPVNWKPYIFPVLISNNLTPYIYIPSEKIPFHNRGKQFNGASIANLSNMNSMEYQVPLNNSNAVNLREQMYYENGEGRR